MDEHSRTVDHWLKNAFRPAQDAIVKKVAKLVEKDRETAVVIESLKKKLSARDKRIAELEQRNKELDFASRSKSEEFDRLRDRYKGRDVSKRGKVKLDQPEHV